MDDCEVPEFYQWSEPVARKEHRCCECRAPITTGEKHFYARMKFDGTFSALRQHLLCCEACMFIRDKIQDGECVYFGGLKEWFSEVTTDRKSDKEIRSMMARILWRERPFRKRRKLAAV